MHCKAWIATAAICALVVGGCASQGHGLDGLAQTELLRGPGVTPLSDLPSLEELGPPPTAAPKARTLDVPADVPATSRPEVVRPAVEPRAPKTDAPSVSSADPLAPPAIPMHTTRPVDNRPVVTHVPYEGPTQPLGVLEPLAAPTASTPIRGVEAYPPVRERMPARVVGRAHDGSPLYATPPPPVMHRNEAPVSYESTVRREPVYRVGEVYPLEESQPTTTWRAPERVTRHVAGPAPVTSAPRLPQGAPTYAAPGATTRTVIGRPLSATPGAVRRADLEAAVRGAIADPAPSTAAPSRTRRPARRRRPTYRRTRLVPERPINDCVT